ncbi:MAG TPA: translocation/assembly module TamB domain-containing protein [Terriglobales bacterium]|nr:translocation/assembly module TamB domain-containing protein [Terriglobales bacterium]
MKLSGAKPGRRGLAKFFLLAFAVCLVFLAAFAAYVTSDSFQAMVRRRFVAALERATGGRVELGSIHSVPLRFEVEVRNLTVHGGEQPSELPYAHVDRLLARVKLSSALGGELRFHSVVLERPTVHLLVRADGTTNQPTPQPESFSAGSSLARLFRFSVNRLEVRQGVVVWNDRVIPLDFLAQDISASMDYSLLRRRYLGRLALGKIDTRFEDFRPAAWRAEVNFELAHDSLAIDSLQAASRRSQFAGSGRMVNFRQPSISGRYDLRLDLAEAAAIAQWPDLRQGTLQLAGRGSWSKAGFSADGQWNLVDFEGGWTCAKLPASTLEGQFLLNPQQLQVRDIRGRLLGGEVGGEAQVQNWQNSLPPFSRGRHDPERGSVRLRMKNLSAEAIAAACSSPARPFERMHLVGSTSASVDTHWKGTARNAEAEIALDVVPPAEVLSAQLPLRAHAHAMYRFSAGELEVSEFNADTLATQARASGVLSARAALKVAFTTTNLGEWNRGLAALGYREAQPFAIRGRAAFTGTATGRLSAIDFTGRLQAQDFQFELLDNRGNRPRKLRADSLSANLELSPYAFAARHGTLRHGTTLLRFDLSAGLDRRRFTDSSPFLASIELKDAEAEEMLALADVSYPLTGRLDLSLRASGTRAWPTGRGWFHLSGGTVAGAVIENAESGFTFEQHRLALDPIRLAYQPGEVRGSGTYDFDRQVFQLNLDGTNFDLAHLPWLGSSPAGVEGRVDFVAQASGNFEQPNLNSQIHFRDLTVGRETLGEYTLDAVSQGAGLRLRGQSHFEAGQLDIEGDIDLEGDWPAKVDFHFNRLQLDPVLVAYLPAALDAHGAISGDLEMRGPLRHRQQLELTGNLTDVLANLGHVALRNQGPIRLMVSNQGLKIQRFQLTGEGTDLEGEGSVAFESPYLVDLHAESHVDLALLQQLNPAFHSSGALALEVNAQGALEHPALEGRVQVTGGLIQYRDLPSALSDLNGSLVFHENRLQIETLTGQAGGGSLRFGGYATLYRRQLNFDLALNAEDVRLRYPPGVSSMTTANLRWTGTPTGSTLSGETTITKLAVIPGFDFGSYLLRTAQASALPQNNPLLSRIRMDVHIVTTPDLEMQTAALNLSGNADLHLRGTAAKPVLLGRADVLEGQVAFNGTRYRLERGDITFANPVTTTPVLDLQASTQVREYDVMINLNGPFDKLNLSYHSEPPLPTADIISLLAPVGTTQEQFGQVQQQPAGSSPFVEQASSEVLAEAVNSALSNRSQRLFGISHIKIDPQGLNEETTPTQTSPLPAVTIEQQVKNNVTLTYTTNVAQTSQQIIQGEYNFSHNLSIVGIRNFNGVVSFEFRMRQSKK